MWGVQQINNPSIWSSHIITYHHQFAWFLPDYILITSMFWKSKPLGLFTCNMDVWGVLGLHLHPHVHLPFSLCFCVFFGVLGEGLLCAAVTALVTRATLMPQVRWWNTQISGRKEIFNLLWSPNSWSISRYIKSLRHLINLICPDHLVIHCHFRSFFYPMPIFFLSDEHGNHEATEVLVDDVRLTGLGLVTQDGFFAAGTMAPVGRAMARHGSSWHGVVQSWGIPWDTSNLPYIYIYIYTHNII